ncbi:ribbon-helix-helix protein, CopG family [Clostridium sp.]|nr:ribbon-helix-helix protein, CopG family [Clostridium sp.]MDU2106402.1 ribbon-helix-helix protein, CopG family [Clostridium sp.]MDU3352724.1 ribbon-helix-helix protein, CopG family [Clostridium sp.]
MKEKYSLLLHLDNDLKQKLEQAAKKLHTSKSQAIRHLIINYNED